VIKHEEDDPHDERWLLAWILAFGVAAVCLGAVMLSG